MKKLLYLLIMTFMFGGCKKNDDDSSGGGSPCEAINSLNASNDSPVPENDTLRLSLSSTVTGASYSWSGPNGFTSTLPNPQINGLTSGASGTYTVTVLSGNCSKTTSTNVTTFNAVTPPCQPNGHIYNIGTISNYTSVATTSSGNNTYFYVVVSSSGGNIFMQFTNNDLLNGNRVKEGVYKVASEDSVVSGHTYFDIDDNSIAYSSLSGWVCVNNFTSNGVDYTDFVWCDVKIKNSVAGNIITTTGKGTSQP